MQHDRPAGVGPAFVAGFAVAIATLTMSAAPCLGQGSRGEEALPRSLTPAERRHLEDHPLVLERDASETPTGPVHCVAEYEPMEGLLMAWEGDSTWKDILAQMVVPITADAGGRIYMVVDSVSEGNSVSAILAADGANMDLVEIIVRATDSIWIRDYGPRYIYEGSCRAFVDHTYNRPRPLDNALPAYFGTYKNHFRYEIPLVHGGGNYHLNALQESNTSRLIVAENPDLTEQEIHDLWLDYQNVYTTFFDPYPTYVDSTQHIDMWMQVIADDAIVISDWPNNQGSVQDQICEAAVDLFEARGYTVTRVPARSVGGTHYTYTNVVLFNDLVFMPTYSNSSVVQHNGPARSAWAAAMPGKTIVQIPSENIVWASGVLHCIVMHVPVPLGGTDPTVYLKTLRGGEVLDPDAVVDIRWISDDDVGTSDVDILLSTDGGVSFDTVIATGTADDGLFAWTVPDVATTQGRLRLVVHDGDGGSGSDESDFDFTITGTSIPGDIDGDGVVGVDDLLVLLASWGACPDPCPPCAADLDGDCNVGVDDLLSLLANWS